VSAGLSQPRCVAMLSPAWPPSAAPNGIVTYTAVMKRALEACGVRVIIVTFGDAPEGRDVSVAIRRPGLASRVLQGLLSRLASNGGYADPARAIAAAARRLRERAGVELLEMEESFGWCGEVGRRSGVPVVARLHGPWFLNGPAVGAPGDGSFHERVLREGRGIAACPGVTSPSRDVLERTRRHYGIELPQAEAIPCPIEALPEASRWKGEGAEAELVLFVGRFDRHKAGDVMIDGFALVAAKRPRARLIVVGPDRGCVSDDGRRWTLPEYLQRLPPGVRDRIQWLGPQPPDALPPLRRRAAVTVVCSRYENFGYAVLEGLAAGCPMVVSRTGGLVEMVEHERSALLCEPGSVPSLAGQLERMLEDRTLAARLALQGVQNVRERFSPGAVANRTLDYYRRVLGMKPSASLRPTGPAPVRLT
jgi:glycosyltransferase involved in cell wall biosynthesis